MYPLRRQDIWIKEQSGKLGQASQQGTLEWKQIAGRQDMAGHSVDNGPTHLEAKWCLDIHDAFDAIIHDFRLMILLTLFLSVVADHYNIF